MMHGFNYKDIYMEDGKRVLEVNILPEKYCNFDGGLPEAIQR